MFRGIISGFAGQKVYSISPFRQLSHGNAAQIGPDYADHRS
jgi:hypothetical protein